MLEEATVPGNVEDTFQDVRMRINFEKYLNKNDNLKIQFNEIF